MRQEIYLDAVFASNYLMDYLLLYLLEQVLPLQRRRFGKFAGAFVGAAGSCLYLFLTNEKIMWAEMLFQGLLAILMLFAGYQIHSLQLWLRSVTGLYLMAFFFGGLWEKILAGKKMNGKIFAGAFAATLVMLRIFLLWKKNTRKKNSRIYPVQLYNRKKICRIQGLYDTGNLLRDPCTQKPVFVTEAEVLKKLLSEENYQALLALRDQPELWEQEAMQELNPHFVCCHTVGGSQLLLAVTLEKLCIQTPEKNINIDHPIVAISSEPSALGKEYQMILNSEFI